MQPNRKQKREWCVYDQEQNLFYNMDCISILENQYLEVIPKKGYSYEEAERFIVHCDNKKFCKIVNIKQPKYLLDFELMVYRKEQASIESKDNMRFVNNSQDIQAESNTKRVNKQRFFTKLGVYRAESLKPMDGVQARELEERKPKIEHFKLTSSDFDAKEKSQLLSYYGFKF